MSSHDKTKEKSKKNPAKKSFKRNLRNKPSRSPLNESLSRTAFVLFKQMMRALLIVLLIISFLLGGMGIGMLVGYITTASPLNILQLQNANETSYIYDADGNEIAKLTGSQNIDREYISYDRFSQTYIDDAFIAIEDERFETHIGIDYRRIMSAIVSLVVTAGNPTSGGSTITQQVVRMVSGADQRSAQRKIQEWYNAIRLERQLKKWEIIELYANLVPMSNNYIGIQSASKGYFGKDASELNLAECAFLAGIPNLPGVYNPLTESGRRNTFRRQRIILGKMLELGRITKEEYDEALETEIRFVTKTITDVNITVNSYFVDYTINNVKKALMTERGYSSDLALTTIYNYGLKIYTTQDPAIQKIVDSAFTNEKLFITNKALVEDFPEHAQAGMIVLDPYSAQIKAMAGGYGEKEANFILNRATGIERQPGSTIKPVAVYAPAIDMGIISGASIIKDQKLFLNKQTPNDPYPRNSYTGYLGNMTVRNALKISSNTVAAQVWMLLGGQNSLDYLKYVGLDRPDENYVSIALGGFNKGMSPLDMAGAYAPFPNNGQYSKPICFTKVTDINNMTILDGTPKFYQIYQPETAAIMNQLLQEPMTSAYTNFPGNGTAAGYQIKNSKGELISTSGKTGTADGNRDKWFVGYTPYYVASVWYGYDGRLKTINIPKSDYMNSVKIWHNVMTKIHSKLEPRDFYLPPTVEEIEICILSGKRATEECKEAGRFVITEYFIEGSPLTPVDFCDIHVAKKNPDDDPDAKPTGGPTASIPEPTSAPTSQAPEPTQPATSSESQPTPTEGLPPDPSITSPPDDDNNSGHESEAP